MDRNTDKDAPDINVHGSFETIFRKPPSRLGEESAKRRGGKNPLNTSIAANEASLTMSDSDDGENNTKVEMNWYDNYVDRKNISIDDQIQEK